MSDLSDYAEARRIFDYDPLTGRLTWLVAMANRVKVGDEVGYETDDRGYRRAYLNGVRHYVHRIIFLWMTGRWPEGDIDHRNRNKRDNRWENFREATRTQNNANSVLRSNSTSGVTGVSFHAQTGKWRAHIGKDGVNVHLGLFKIFEDAVEKRRAAEIEYFGEFARVP